LDQKHVQMAHAGYLLNIFYLHQSFLSDPYHTHVIWKCHLESAQLPDFVMCYIQVPS
jgi:hypothetical protein